MDTFKWAQLHYDQQQPDDHPAPDGPETLQQVIEILHMLEHGHAYAQEHGTPEQVAGYEREIESYTSKYKALTE